MGVLITPQLKSLTFELKIEGYYTLCYTGLPPAPRRLEDLWNVYLRVHIDGGNFLIGIAFFVFIMGTHFEKLFLYSPCT